MKRIRALILLSVLLPGKGGAEPLSLGGIFCLTGEIASGCNAIREGAEIALEEVNRSGGIRGRELRVEFQDSQFNPKFAHTIAQRFAADPKILGVLITGVVETKTAGPVLERAHLPSITLWDSSPEIDEIGEYAFGIGPWLPSTYELSAQFARETLLAQTAATFCIESEWSLLVSKSFARVFEDRGGRVLDESCSPPDSKDFRTVLVRALAKRPDVLYAPVIPVPIFMKQARELGFKGSIITSDNLNDHEISLAPWAIEGAYQSMVADPETPEARALAKLYEDRFGRRTDMLVYNAWGYDGVRLFAEAIRQSDGTREAIRSALLKLKDFPAATGKITFRPEGSFRGAVSMFVVRNGKLTLVSSE